MKKWMVFGLAACMLLSGCDKDNAVEQQDVSQTVELEQMEPPSVEVEPVQDEGQQEEVAQIEPALSSLYQERNVIQVTYEATDIQPMVSPYRVNEDLSNIANLDRYPGLTERQRELLIQNGFFVQPSLQEQLFYIYESNEYKLIPSFVTTDSVLQVYHTFYNYSLRTLEQEALLGLLEDLNDSLLNKMILLHRQADNKNVQDAAFKNIAFLGAAQLALEKELPSDMPWRAVEFAETEYTRMEAAAGFEESVIYGFDLDYSQYRPRGHYTRNDALKRYFKTMMWYGQVPMPLYKEADDGSIQRDVEHTLMAMLLSHAVFMENEGQADAVRWENIYEPTKFYVGAADDLDVFSYKKIMEGVYGESLILDTMDDAGYLDAFYTEADLLPEPQIQPKYVEVNAPTAKQFRLMGQRFVPDADIIQSVVEPLKRPVPKGLDVMAAMGSERAEELLFNHYQEQLKWDQYPFHLNRMKTQYSELDQSIWQSNMYYGWLWTLKGFLQPYEAGYPSFMTNTAWTDKSLSTALGSWSELKHDTVLYGKQSGAECGGGEEPPEIRGYVEPSIEVYEKLKWLNSFSKANLKQRGILPAQMEGKLDEFNELLTFLIHCSVKELNNESLNAEENYQLLTYGGLLEYLTASFAGDGYLRWFEITSETDKNMAVVADIHTIAPSGYFEVGVGPAHEIYVVVPIDGKLYLTRGAVFSYYEFVSDGKRLTDEEWQQMIKDGQAPPQEDWIQDYQGGPESFEVPDPVEPYSSGC